MSSVCLQSLLSSYRKYGVYIGNYTMLSQYPSKKNNLNMVSNLPLAKQASEKHLYLLLLSFKFSSYMPLSLSVSSL